MIERGLDDQTVAANEKTYGPNTLVQGKVTPIWKIFLTQ